jgi:acyl-CoA dehydrogenase
LPPHRQIGTAAIDHCHAVDSNLLFIDGLKVPVADRIGENGKGFHYILHGMNPERILIAAEAVGLGRAALDRAARYAKERVVFGRAIGQNQAIQHPLAERWIELEAAELMVLRAAAAYDRGEEAGAYANAANTVPPRLASMRARLRS